MANHFLCSCDVYRAYDMEPVSAISHHYYKHTTVRGPGIFMWCNCFGICYIYQTNKCFVYRFFIFDKISSRAGWNGFSGRSLETHVL